MARRGRGSSAVRLAATVALCVLVSLLAGAFDAFAQNDATSFQLEHFEPFPAQSTNVANLASSAPVADDRPTFGLTLHFVDDPLQLRADDEETTRVVDDQFKAELTAAWGFLDLLDVGLAIPLVLYQSSDGLADLGDGEVGSFALGDIRLIPRVRVVRPEWAGGVGVAVLLPVYLPTGDTGSFTGDDGVRVEPRVAIDWRHEPTGIHLLANVGYQLRRETVVLTYVSDDLLRWGLGARAPLVTDELRAYATLFGQFTLAEGRDPLDPTAVAPNEEGQPVETQFGVQYALNDLLSLQAGGGFGVTSDVGAADFRLLAGVEYSPRIVFDEDGDGVPNAEDQCPDELEDQDGFEDADGCPDPDNDGDSIPDERDSCPDDPEDFDGFNDQDGCPDLDNDDDTVPDTEDRCPDAAGKPEYEGCPDADDDGLADDRDECPDAGEDFDGFEDDDGCPDWDNDGDGIIDAEDQCPMEPEVVNLNEDEDGCPDEGESYVEVTPRGFQILESIDFVRGPRIRWRSRKVLDHVASALRNHSMITAVRIEVHTTSQRDPQANVDLSQEQADVVREYLIDQGVKPERLDALGRGDVEPDEEKGNDRVEFVVAERATAPEVAEPEEPEEPQEAEGFDDFDEPDEPQDSEEVDDSEESEGFEFGTDDVQ